MNDVTKFTHIKFLSVLKSDSIPKLLAVLGETFKVVENANHQDDVVLVYRDILFCEQDMQKPLIREKEGCFLHKLLEKQVFKAEHLASFIVKEQTVYLKNENVIAGGRTVCADVYPELASYVE